MSNTVGMPPGVRFSGWLERTPAGAGVVVVRFVMPGGTKTETFCFLPFSSTVKSSGFKPANGWPFLWVTTTSTTTSRVFARIVMLGTSAGACWALRIVGPVARFKISAEMVTIRKGRLRNMEPPAGASELGGIPGMYRVSDPLANHVLGGSEWLGRPKTFRPLSFIPNQHLPDVCLLPTIEVHSKIL